MPHGKTWLSFLPFADDLHQMVEAYGPSWMFNNPVHVQHLLAIVLVSLVMLLLALFARAGMGKAKGEVLPDDKLHQMVEA